MKQYLKYKALIVLLLVLTARIGFTEERWVCNKQGIKASVNGADEFAIRDITNEPQNGALAKDNPASGPQGPTTPFEEKNGGVSVGADGGLRVVLSNGVVISKDKPAYTPDEEVIEIEAEIDPVTGKVISVKFKNKEGGWTAPRGPITGRVPVVTPTPLPACGSASAPQCAGSCPGGKTCTPVNNRCECQSNAPVKVPPGVVTGFLSPDSSARAQVDMDDFASSDEYSANELKEEPQLGGGQQSGNPLSGESCIGGCPAFEAEYHPASGIFEMTWSDGSKDKYQQYRIVSPGLVYRFRILSKLDPYGIGKQYFYRQDGTLERTREGLIEKRFSGISSSSWAEKYYACQDAQCQTATEMPQFQVTYTNDAAGRLYSIRSAPREYLNPAADNQVYSGSTSTHQAEVRFGFDSSNNPTTVSEVRAGEVQVLVSTQYTWHAGLGKQVVSSTTDSRGLRSTFEYILGNNRLIETKVNRGGYYLETYVWDQEKRVTEHTTTALKGVAAEGTGDLAAPKEMKSKYEYSDCGCSIVKSYTDPAGNKTDYTYQPGTTSISSVEFDNPTGSGRQSLSFIYGAFEDGTPLLSAVDQYGNRTSYNVKLIPGTRAPEEISSSYTVTDVNGRLQTLVSRARYNASGQAACKIDPVGRVTEYRYGERDLIEATLVGPAGSATCTVNAGHHDSTQATLEREAITRNVTGLRLSPDSRLLVSWQYWPQSQRQFSATYWGEAGRPLAHTEYSYDRFGAVGLVSRLNRGADGQGVQDYRSASSTRGRGVVKDHFIRNNFGDLIVSASEKLGLHVASIGSTLTPNEYDYRRFKYDATTGLMLGSSDPFGNTKSYKYNGFFDLAAISLNGTEMQRYGYNVAGVAWQETLSREQNSSNDYVRTNFSRANGLKGGVVASVNPLGIESRLSVSTDGRELVRTTKQAGATLSRTISRVDELGRVVSSSMQGRNGRNVLLGNFKYNGLQLESVSDQYGAVLRFEYDAVGRVREAVGPFVRRTLNYAANSTRVARSVSTGLAGDAPQSVTDYQYDNLGRVISTNSWVQGAGGQGIVSISRYDSLGNVVESLISSALGKRETKLGHSADGFVEYKISAPENQVISAERLIDTAAREVGLRLIDARGLVHESRQSFDGLSARSKSPGRPWHTASFSKAGALRQTQTAAGVLHSFSYDYLGRLSSSRAGGGGALGVIERSQSYNSLGQLERAVENSSLRGSQSASFGYDEFGVLNLISTQLPSTYTTTASIESWDYVSPEGFYNPARPSRVTAAGLTTKYQYDNVGRIIRVAYDSAPSGVESLIAEYQYKDGSRTPSLIKGPNGIERSYSFDERGLLAKSQVLQAGRVVDGFRVASRDKFDQPNGFEWLGSTAARGGVGERYETNAKGYLETAKLGLRTADFSSPISQVQASESTSVQYPANSVLRSSVSTSGSNARNEVFVEDPATGAYAALNSQAITYNHDGLTTAAAGSSFGYDPYGRLLSVQTGAETVLLDYDVLGRQVAQFSANGTAMKLLRYAGESLVAEGEAPGGQFAAEKYFGYGVETFDQVSSFSKRNNSGVFETYAIAPGYNSQSAAFGANGLVETYSFDVNGRRRVRDAQGQSLANSSIGNNFGFTAQPEIADGVMNFRNRAFNTNTNTFLQPEGPLTNPANGGNLYQGFSLPQVQRDRDGWQTKTSQNTEVAYPANWDKFNELAKKYTDGNGDWTTRSGVKLNIHLARADGIGTCVRCHWNPAMGELQGLIADRVTFSPLTMAAGVYNSAKNAVDVAVDGGIEDLVSLIAAGVFDSLEQSVLDPQQAAAQSLVVSAYGATAASLAKQAVNRVLRKSEPGCGRGTVNKKELDSKEADRRRKTVWLDDLVELTEANFQGNALTPSGVHPLELDVTFKTIVRRRPTLSDPVYSIIMDLAFSDIEIYGFYSFSNGSPMLRIFRFECFGFGQDYPISIGTYTNGFGHQGVRSVLEKMRQGLVRANHMRSDQPLTISIERFWENPLVPVVDWDGPSFINRRNIFIVRP